MQAVWNACCGNHCTVVWSALKAMFSVILVAIAEHSFNEFGNGVKNQSFNVFALCSVLAAVLATA